MSTENSELARRLEALETEVATMGDVLRLEHHSNDTRHAAVLEQLQAFTRRFDALEGEVRALPRTVAQMLAEDSSGKER